MYSESLSNSSPFKSFIYIKIKLNFYYAFYKAIANKRLLASSHLSARRRFTLLSVLMEHLKYICVKINRGDFYWNFSTQACFC